MAYKITCEVPAKDISGEVKLNITLADGTKSMDYTYSVESYLKYLANDPKKYEKEQKVAAALTNYGNVANAYFNKENIVETEEMKNVTADDVQNYKATLGDKNALPEGITYKSTSLILESETTLRHYFNVTDDAVDTATEYGLKKVSDGLYCYDFAHIKAQNLGEAQTLKIEGFAITASPLSYAYAVLNGNSDNGLKNLVKSMYLYNQTAKEYNNK
jgi:hypothetical protein